jgi:Putative collagen-binding domain of a collagenase
LVPDTSDTLVTRGRGAQLKTDKPMDVLDNDYVTAAKTPDGRFAVIFMPAKRTISVNRAALSAGCRAVWIDPASGARHPVPMSSTFTTPGTNAGGDADWLLLFTSLRQ